jgi:UDP-N-acetylglucosamine/UDP-N-acetylgalactosamine diphosphorylase
VHIIAVAFAEKLATDPEFELPFHRAEKKVPHIDLQTGKPVKPESPNAVKLERFIFDAIPLCRGSIVLETERVEEFAPIKNAEGVDSPATSHAIQTERAARWLTAAGVNVPRREDGTPDCTLEISPLTALEAEDLRGKILPRRIERGASVAL